MPSEFLCGQVQLLLKRCHTLRKHLYSLKTLPQELNLYVNNLDTELERLADEIQQIIADPDLGVKSLLKNQINTYRRYAERVNLVEAYPLTLLDQFNNKDYYFYCFAKLFCKQVKYSYESPLVSAHSSEYFYAFPTANIINLPLCEDQFLLAIPDFVHELGHLVYDYHENEVRKPFAKTLISMFRNRKNVKQTKGLQKHIVTTSTC